MLRNRRSGATSDLLLVASLVTLVPSWIGGVQFLSAVGFGSVPAAVVGGAYAWGRGGLSAAILLRRWRRGTLALGRAWFREAAASAIERCPTVAYPAPSRARISLSSPAAGPVPV